MRVSDVSIRVKLAALAAVVIALMIAVGFVGHRATTQLRAEVDEIAAVQLQGLQLLIQADRDMQQALVAERSLLAPGLAADQREALVKVHQENAGQAETRFEAFVELGDKNREEAGLIEDHRTARKN